jgi:hypothetical protein
MTTSKAANALAAVSEFIFIKWMVGGQNNTSRANA